MKRSIASLTVVFSGLFLCCEKGEERHYQSNLPTLDSAKESELVAAKQKLTEELDRAAIRRNELESEIAAMKERLIEWTGNLRTTEAERAKMLEEGYWLKRRWEKELEGVVEAPSRPISELYGELAQKMDQLLQENAELKKKLQEAGK